MAAKASDIDMDGAMEPWSTRAKEMEETEPTNSTGWRCQDVEGQRTEKQMTAHEESKLQRSDTRGKW